MGLVSPKMGGGAVQEGIDCAREADWLDDYRHTEALSLRELEACTGISFSTLARLSRVKKCSPRTKKTLKAFMEKENSRQKQL